MTSDNTFFSGRTRLPSPRYPAFFIAPVRKITRLRAGRSRGTSIKTVILGVSKSGTVNPAAVQETRFLLNNYYRDV